MWRIKVLVIIFTLSFLSIFQFPIQGDTQEVPESHKIQGFVLDKENNPVADIWIRIYRGTTDIGSDITNRAGHYFITFKQGSPITTVRFDDMHSDPSDRFHPTMVLNLPGDRGHQLNKTMPGRVTYGTDLWEQLEVLSAYERVFALDRDFELPGSEEHGLAGNEMLKRYRVNLNMFKGTDLAAQRLKQVRALYER